MARKAAGCYHITAQLKKQKAVHVNDRKCGYIFTLACVSECIVLRLFDSRYFCLLVKGKIKSKCQEMADILVTIKATSVTPDCSTVIHRLPESEINK